METVWMQKQKCYNIETKNLIKKAYDGRLINCQKQQIWSKIFQSYR